MASRVAWTAAFAVCGSAVAIALAWRQSCRATPEVFALCVAHVDGPKERAAHTAWSPGLVDAVALSLSEEKRREIEALLAPSTTRWEARANPMLEDLEDDDPDAEVAGWLAHAPAQVTTAMAASKSRYCGADGFCVRVIAASDRCPPGWAAPRSDADRDRARFLAWPFGHAVLLHASSEVEALAAAETLRTAARRSTRLGIVVSASDAELAARAPYASFRERWGRHEAWKHAAQSADSDGGSRTEESGSNAIFPARLDRTDLVVLPRLEAIQDPSAFIGEVRDLLPRKRVTSAWR